MIPAVTPAQSISTSRTAGPRSGTNRWMVSSMQAAAAPQTNAQWVGFLIMEIRQHSSMPRAVNSYSPAEPRDTCPLICLILAS